MDAVKGSLKVTGRTAAGFRQFARFLIVVYDFLDGKCAVLHGFMVK